MRHDPSLLAQDWIGEPTVRAPLHGGFSATPDGVPLPAVAMIVHGGHSGDVQERTPLQRLVGTMLDRAEATSPTVKYDIWMPSLESAPATRPSRQTAGCTAGCTPLPHPHGATLRHPCPDCVGVPRGWGHRPTRGILLLRRPDHGTHHQPLGAHFGAGDLRQGAALLTARNPRRCAEQRRETLLAPGRLLDPATHAAPALAGRDGQGTGRADGRG